MLYLILRVAGVPPMEERLLATRGNAYRAYQRRTSIFVPLPEAIGMIQHVPDRVLRGAIRGELSAARLARERGCAARAGTARLPAAAPGRADRARRREGEDEQHAEVPVEGSSGSCSARG